MKTKGFPKFSHVKNKYDLPLCQSHLHTAFETFIRKKKIGSGLMHFRIRSMHFDRKGWGIRKNISDS